MASFAEQLRALTNPEPSRFDLDEDEFDLTRAQVIDKDTDLDDIKKQTVSSSSNLRKKAVTLLQDEDEKYAGQRITRAQLKASRNHPGRSETEEESAEENYSQDLPDGVEMSEDDYEDDFDDVKSDFSEDDVDDAGSNVQVVNARRRNKHDAADDKDGENGNNVDDDDDDDENSRTHSTNEEHNEEYLKDKLDSDDGDDDDNDDDDDDDDNDDEDEAEDKDEDEELEHYAGDEAIQKFSLTSLTDDIEKGKAARNQLSLWDNFLELRIRLQKALLIANKLPQQAQIEKFKSSGDQNLKEAYKQGKRAVAKLLENLLVVQEKLLGQNPDTASVLKPGAERNQSSVHVSDDDEEIPSESEDEKSDENDDDVKNSEDEDKDAEDSLKLPAKRKHEMATSEYSNYISKRHAAFKSYRDATISKWSEKTRLASGKFNSKSFSSFDRSALMQINHILSDKDRLVKRSQLKRTAYRVLGKPPEEEEDPISQPSEEQSDVHLRDYDPEIFDDDDFYHQLLREFIEQRTSGSTGNPVDMGRQWLELQKLRRKGKKKVDTKASKGRKIRYDVHGKLVSFMAPIEKGIMADSSRNELFSSLFGTKQQEQVADINVFK